MKTRSHAQHPQSPSEAPNANSRGVLVWEEKPHGRISLRSSAGFPVSVQYTFRNIDEAELTFKKRLDQIDDYDLLGLSYRLHTC